MSKLLYECFFFIFILLSLGVNAQTADKSGHLKRYSKEFYRPHSFYSIQDALVNGNGDTLISYLKHYEIDSMSGEYYVIHGSYRCLGIINKDGRMIVPIDYDDFSQGCIDYAPEFHDGIIELSNNHKTVFLDTLGNLIVPENKK